MCGIAGVISLGRPLDPSDRATAEAMTRVLRHRGPDSTGFAGDERCILGNTRLKILDLSDAANLPMSSDDGQIHLAYNGEVTNFRELRSRFRLDERHRFRTSSDTEVVLALYRERGIEFLRELSGMFALCIHDRRIGKAYVVRDFFGMRPLFVRTRYAVLPGVCPGTEIANTDWSPRTSTTPANAPSGSPANRHSCSVALPDSASSTIGDTNTCSGSRSLVSPAPTYTGVPAGTSRIPET